LAGLYVVSATVIVGGDLSHVDLVRAEQGVDGSLAGQVSADKSTGQQSARTESHFTSLALASAK